jgi:NADH-quinone oxidoreductase subunit L
LFSGFWSKDEILHAAHSWPVSHVPFILGIIGALLTAFYMTRQVALVFFGKNRSGARQNAGDSHSHGKVQPLSSESSHDAEPHESPTTMTVPLVILAACSILLGFIGTPAWPWFQKFLGGEVEAGFSSGVVKLMLLSTGIVFLGLFLGWLVYGRRTLHPERPDILKRLRPDLYSLIENKFYIDEIYEATVIRFNAWFAQLCDAIDFWVWNGAVQLLVVITVALSWTSRFCDELVVNLGFDEGCKGLSSGGKLMSRLQDGRIQNYLRVIGIALTALVLLLIWGCRAS